MVKTFDPLAEAFGVTRKVVVPLACGPTVIGVAEKLVGQLAITVAVKANERGAQPTGSLLNRVIVDDCWTLGGPDVVVGFAESVGTELPHGMTVAVTLVVPPLVELTAIVLEPLAEGLGVTVKVVVPVACAATVIGLGAKAVAQLPGAGFGTTAPNVNARGAQPT